jgi:transcriptional regulator with XRE-family HTH domain
MDMKVDCSLIKAERERRAWSQEHLAEVTGLGLRTIQRIEKTGIASYESARSLAAVFEIDVGALRVEPAAPVPPKSVALRPWLGFAAGLGAGGALLLATTSFADQVLMDVNVAVDASGSSRALQTRVLVDDGAAVPNVNDVQLGDLRFSIVPRVRPDGRILLEVGVFERRGDEEVVLGQPRLIASNGEAAAVGISLGDERTLRLSITAQVNPPELPPMLRALGEQ